MHLCSRRERYAFGTSRQSEPCFDFGKKYSFNDELSYFQESKLYFVRSKSVQYFSKSCHFFLTEPVFEKEPVPIPRASCKNSLPRFGAVLATPIVPKVKLKILVCKTILKMCIFMECIAEINHQTLGSPRQHDDILAGPH